MIRGGQTLLHSLHMFAQVGKKLVWVVSLVFLLGIMALMWVNTRPHQRYALLKLIEAELRGHLALWQGGEYFGFESEEGLLYPALSVNTFLNSQGVRNLKKELLAVILRALCFMVLISIGILILLIGFLVWRGNKVKQKQHLRGAKRCNFEQFQKLMKGLERSEYTLGGLPLVKGSENRHMLFCGVPGTGKSVATKELMDQVRAQDQRAVVYDIDQAFIAEFYRPDKDIILNPLDSRCPNWNIWQECDDFADYQRIAESMMPDHLASSDSFWISAARSVFSAALGKLQEQGRLYTPTLLEYLFSSNTDGLHQLVKGTVAEPLTTDKLQKMAMSIVATLATYCSALLYLKESQNSKENTFSIREWIRQDSDSWLFISTTQNKKTTLKPLFSVWVDVAIHTLLSLPPDLKRKIWFLTDEFASLHRLPSIMDLVSRARKYGGCLVATVQDLSQIQSIYGREDAATLIGLFGTRVYFRVGDTVSARQASEYFGKSEISEANEGLSYGAHEMRDGVQLNRRIREEPIVLESEIMTLNDLEAFIKMPGGCPVTQIKFELKERHTHQPPLIPRPLHLSSVAPRMQEALKQADTPFASAVLQEQAKDKEAHQKDYRQTELPVVEHKISPLIF